MMRLLFTIPFLTHHFFCHYIFFILHTSTPKLITNLNKFIKERQDSKANDQNEGGCRTMASHATSFEIQW
jgi:hypothetical protein